LATAAPSFEQTDWPALCRSYEHLLEFKPNPVVRVNAAIARAYADGPAAGLEQLMQLRDYAKLSIYASFHAARGDLLMKVERYIEAVDAFKAALNCPPNAVERKFLLSRAQLCKSRESRQHLRLEQLETLPGDCGRDSTAQGMKYD
jgi:predicted RNA polymerase sigma factor